MNKMTDKQILFAYVKSQGKYVLYQCVFIALIVAFFILFQLEYHILILFLIFCLTGNCLYVLSEYIPRRRYYKELFSRLASMDDKEFAIDIIERPTFWEGELTNQTITVMSKYIKEQVDVFSHHTMLQQDYIDTWLHEIKTPIACLQMIAANVDVETRSKMNLELERTQQYLEQVLYYSKVATATEDYLIRKVSLENIINEALKLNSNYLIQNQASIEKRDTDVDVYTDEKWLQFIVSQIIINAIKYKKDDVKLTFSAKQGKEVVVLSITDTGIGISQSDLKKVFLKGYTGENGHLRGNATGIGLYLCHVLAQKLYLGIEIESEVGKYTTVKLTIPLNQKLMDRKEERGYM
ncbi:MAG: sensor histidine kinase [Culicoidibacterales bacterium]